MKNKMAYILLGLLILFQAVAIAQPVMEQNLLPTPQTTAIETIFTDHSHHHLGDDFKVYINDVEVGIVNLHVPPVLPPPKEPADIPEELATTSEFRTLLDSGMLKKGNNTIKITSGSNKEGSNYDDFEELELLWSYEPRGWWDRLVTSVLGTIIPEIKMMFLTDPLVADGKVFVIFNSELHAIDADTGKKIWSYDPFPFGGLRPPIAIADGKVVVSFDKIYAFDADTGETIWSFEIENPRSIVVAEGKIFVSSQDKIYCLDEDTGDLIRSYEFPAPPSWGWSYPSLAIAEGKIIVKSGNKIYVLDEDTGKTIWSYVISIATSISIADGKVFVGSEDSKIYALDEDTGKLIWSYDLAHNISNDGPRSLAVAPGKVFVGTMGNKIYALNEDTGDLIWSYEIGMDAGLEYLPISSGISSIAIADKKVFVGTESSSKIYALDADTGDLIWYYDEIRNCIGSIAIADKKVFVGTKYDKIYCFGAKEEKGVLGFEVIFALAVLFVVAYLLRRRMKNGK